jgi:hypothetical protein
LQRALIKSHDKLLIIAERARLGKPRHSQPYIAKPMISGWNRLIFDVFLEFG